MIDEVARFVRDRIEQGLQAQEPKGDGWVVLSNVVNPDGSTPEGVADKIVMSLASLQQESFVRNSPPRIGEEGAPGPHPVIVSLYFTLTAVFTGSAYPQGLRLLSRTLSILAANPVLNAAGAAAPEGDDQALVELVSLDFEQRQCVARAGGLKGLPFAMFRVRGVELAAGSARSGAA